MWSFLFYLGSPSQRAFEERAKRDPVAFANANMNVGLPRHARTRGLAAVSRRGWNGDVNGATHSRPLEPRQLLPRVSDHDANARVPVRRGNAGRPGLACRYLMPRRRSV